MEKMTEAERKYWEQKRRLLLSEAAEIERMLDADRPAKVLPAVVEPSVSGIGLPSVGVAGAGKVTIR